MVQRNERRSSTRATAAQQPPKAHASSQAHTHVNPYWLYGSLFGGLAILLAAFIWWVTSRFDVVLAWFIGISVATFAAWGYDKSIAGTGKLRVPERVLLGLTFAGGTIGALIGMRVFHHKTIKESFRRQFWVVVGVQIVLIVVYVLLR
jgi:uncharacterized membrane protein YsdA (DUF1294 family)